MRMAANAGTDTNRDVSESTRKRNTMICEKSSVTTERTESPARDLFPDQKAMSLWKARNSKSRCSDEAMSVMARR